MSGSNGNVLNPAGNGAILNQDAGAGPVGVPAGLLRVGPPGSGFEFATISDALAAGAARFPSDPFAVLVWPGDYPDAPVIDRGGVSIFGFANQSFQTQIAGLRINPLSDALISIANFVVNGQISVEGNRKAQIWSDNVSVQGPASPLQLINTASGTQLLGRNLRAVSTAGEPAILYALTGTSAEVSIYGGNALVRAGGGPSDAVAVGVAAGAVGQLTIAGPNVLVDGKIEHFADATALILTDILVRTASTSPITIQSNNVANTVANCGLVATAPPAPFAIDGSAGSAVSYLNVTNFTLAATPINPAIAASNLASLLIP